MGVQASWDNQERTIFHYRFDEQWTWEEFFAAKQRANALMDAVSHRIGVILEPSPDGRIQPNLLANARNGLRTKHPNTVIIVFVVTRPFVRTMIGTIRALSPLANTRIEVAWTVDEARAIIGERLRIYNPARHTSG